MEYIQKLILTAFTFIITFASGSMVQKYTPSTSDYADSGLRAVSAGYPIVLTSSAYSVEQGGYATLTSQTNGMNSCEISGGIYGAGQNVSIPLWSGWTGGLHEDTSFTLTCLSGTDVRYEVAVLVKANKKSLPTNIPPQITELVSTSTPSPTVHMPASPIPSPTLPPLSTPTHPPTSTATPSLTPPITTLPTAVPTKTPPPLPTFTSTPYPTKAPTHTPTRAPTASPTKTPSPTLSITPTRTPTNSPSPSMTPKIDHALITTAHRYQAGYMFGGWGPHLGHLLRASDKSLWFADDTGNDVQKVPALQYFHEEQGKWVLIGSNTTYGRVQQNFGSVLKYDVIYSYGVDVENHKIEECYFVIATRLGACNLLPFPLDPNANYIGAALTPSGYTIVWWTNVYEGGGSFEYIYNFGGGWNGPIKSSIGTYSDVSYINIGFQNDSSFTLLAQGVSGIPPNWTYTPLLARGTIGKVVSKWSTIPSMSASDRAISTNDLWIDRSGGAHLLTRTANGALQYGYQSSPSSEIKNTLLIKNAYRGRFVEDGLGTVSLVHSSSNPAGDVVERMDYQKASVVGAIPWDTSARVTYPLPSGFGKLYAIYSESRVYQLSPITSGVFAVNGSTSQGNVYAIKK